MKLVASDHPALRTVSRPVEDTEVPALRKQWPQLLVFMTRNQGVGLAANQLGDTRRYFVWQDGLVINPVIEKASEEKSCKAEGCLSFPGLIKAVTRPDSIIVSYTDERGVAYKCRVLRGKAAQIFQHELDHLNGKVIADIVNV